MREFELDRQTRWLFCFGHPDDETAIAGWMHRLTRFGCDVFLSWTGAIPVRREESRRLAERFGIPNDRLYFHDGEDGNMVDQLVELRPSFAAMMREVRPTRVASVAFEQGHLDHDATNWLVHRTWSGPVLEIPLYHTYADRFIVANRFSDPRSEAVLTLTPAERRMKSRAARSFPSQRLYPILVANEVITTLRGRPSRLAYADRMRWQPWTDFRSPAHPDATARRVSASPRWQRWLRAVGDAENQGGTL